jgi:hypothetical protein
MLHCGIFLPPAPLRKEICSRQTPSDGLSRHPERERGIYERFLPESLLRLAEGLGVTIRFPLRLCVRFVGGCAALGEWL